MSHFVNIELLFTIKAGATTTVTTQSGQSAGQAPSTDDKGEDHLDDLLGM